MYSAPCDELIVLPKDSSAADKRMTVFSLVRYVSNRDLVGWGWLLQKSIHSPDLLIDGSSAALTFDGGADGGHGSLGLLLEGREQSVGLRVCRRPTNICVSGSPRILQDDRCSYCVHNPELLSAKV